MKKLLATIVLCVMLSSILAVSVLPAGGPSGGGGVSDLLAGGLYNPLQEGAIGG